MSFLKDQHLHVMGLGLMGASLAMALRGKVSLISGSDIDSEIEQTALHDGVIDCVTTPAEADIVIVAIPAHLIGPMLGTLELKSGATVMDLGSTKHSICNVMDTLPEQIQAVGGHPMCGLAENGYKNAIPTLYSGARFILCETARTTDTARSLGEQIAAGVGAIPLWMERAEHDRLAGAISHLPHLMSFALMRLAMQLAENGDHVYEMAAGGFDGATRLARTDESMIVGMFSTNSDEIRQLVQHLRQHLDDLTALLDNPDTLRHELSKIVAARREYTRRYGERMIT
jgi:prephenate dehydrogenase